MQGRIRYLATFFLFEKFLHCKEVYEFQLKFAKWFWRFVEICSTIPRNFGNNEKIAEKLSIIYLPNLEKVAKFTRDSIFSSNVKIVKNWVFLKDPEKNEIQLPQYFSFKCLKNLEIYKKTEYFFIQCWKVCKN